MSRKIRGRLHHIDEVKIQKQYSFLLDNFDPTLDGSLDELFSEGVFDQHDKDSVENGGESTARGRAERFLKILLNSGKNAYQAFLDALRKCGSGHIADTLDNTEVSDVDREVTITGPLAWIDRLSVDIKQRQPTDAEASRLSAAFGHGWESVFSEMEISLAKIQQMQMANPYSPAIVITNLIIKWRQQHAGNAHLIKLLKAMEAVHHDGRCKSIDWALVKSVATGEK